MPGNASIRATLFAPDQTIVARGAFRVDDLFPQKTLSIALRSNAGPGIYRLRLVPAATQPGGVRDTLVARYFIRPYKR
ncbi:MAG: hypothetical protein ABI968_14685 [Acidobacteriota bacterium]